MCGCSSRATSCASASKRRMNSGSLASAGRMTLTATSRPTCGWTRGGRRRTSPRRPARAAGTRAAAGRRPRARGPAGAPAARAGAARPRARCRAPRPAPRARGGRRPARRPGARSGTARSSGAPTALAQRVGARQRLELGDELGVAAERELGDDALLGRRGAQLLEMGDLRAQRRLVGEIVQRGAAPQRVGLAVQALRGRRVARPRRRASRRAPRSGARRSPPARRAARSRPAGARAARRRAPCAGATRRSAGRCAPPPAARRPRPRRSAARRGPACWPAAAGARARRAASRRRAGSARCRSAPPAARAPGTPRRERYTGGLAGERAHWPSRNLQAVVARVRPDDTRRARGTRGKQQLGRHPGAKRLAIIADRSRAACGDVVFVAVTMASPPSGVTPTVLARGTYDAFSVSPDPHADGLHGQGQVAHRHRRAEP